MSTASSHGRDAFVSVGVPTRNRAAKLARAIESVLVQTHAELELVIVDDASTDVTETVCGRFDQHDSRVRYVRSPSERGQSANLNALARELRGRHVLLLADDEWLEPTCVATCLAALHARSDVALARAGARYTQAESAPQRGAQERLEGTRAGGRVLGALGTCGAREAFAGVMARETLERATPVREVPDGDRLLLPAIAAQGRVVTVEDAIVNRDGDGPEREDGEHRGERVRELITAPRLASARDALVDVAWRTRGFRSLPVGARAGAALAAAGSTLGRGQTSRA